jgi:hypothetical protein
VVTFSTEIGMRTTTIARLGAGLFPVILAAQSLGAQGTAADYARSDRLNARYEGLAVNTPDRPTWIGRSPRLWYRRTVKGGGYEFMVVDVAAKTKQPAFDHTKLAAALVRAGLSEVPAVGRGGGGGGAPAPGTPTLVSATNLPFADFTFADDEHASASAQSARADEVVAAAAAARAQSLTTNRATWSRSKDPGTTSRRSATR